MITPSEPTDPPGDAPGTADAPPTPVRNTVTTPEGERAGLMRPNVVAALMSYDTHAVHLLPRPVRRITMGAVLGQDAFILVEGENVSAQHCRLERQDRKGELLRVVDLKSKNGTFVDGERVTRSYLRPGQVLTLGARPHRFLAVNEAMFRALPALKDILGTEIEHSLDGARDTPSPSDLIVTAVGGAPLLIISDPDCEQHRLASIIHDISRLRERPIVRHTARDLPGDRKAQIDLVARAAARSTFVLDLVDWNDAMPPVELHLVQLLQKPRYRVRTIVLASNRDLVGAALSWSFEERLTKLWLRPIVERPQAIDRLLDRMFEEVQSPLQTAHFTLENQEAIRNYAWPGNFSELRRGAVWLTAIHRTGSVLAAASALDVPPKRIYSWLSASQINVAPMFRPSISLRKSPK